MPTVSATGPATPPTNEPTAPPPPTAKKPATSAGTMQGKQMSAGRPKSHHLLPLLDFFISIINGCLLAVPLLIRLWEASAAATIAGPASPWSGGAPTAGFASLTGTATSLLARQGCVRRSMLSGDGRRLSRNAVRLAVVSITGSN